MKVTTTPFADAARLYLDAGWGGVLPLPERRKANPPEGFTGRAGRWPTEEHINQWIRTHAHGNIALRLPTDVIGIDIDAHKDPAVRERLEAITGPLPPTWCSTARVDGSGIRLYRCQPPPAGKRWINTPTPAVEIIQHHHRYAVVWPSIHPDTDTTYRWVDEVSGEITNQPPRWDDLTELPWQATTALLVDDDTAPQRPPAPFTLTTGDMTPAVRQRLEEGLRACRNQPGSRHDTVRDLVAALVRLAERGDTGVQHAIDTLGEAFVAAVAPNRPGGERTARREYQDLVTGAERLVAGTVGRIPTRDERLAQHQPTLTRPSQPPTDQPPRRSIDIDELLAEEEDEPAPHGLEAALIHWPDFWANNPAAEEWLIKPFIARGRGHAVYAGAKTGKSYIVLAACAALATGRPTLGQPPGEPIDVLYVDYEMTDEDLRERLEEFGYDADSDLSHLHYALLPSVPPLDTETGGLELVRVAEQVGAQLVVIDTTSRAVSGPENENDTYLAFYRFCGKELKRRHIAYIRIDHAGKDITKGQRGASAKNDDVDVVWRLSRRDNDGMRFEATHARMSWVRSFDAVKVDSDDGVTFICAESTDPTGTWHIVDLLEKVGAPPNITRKQVRALMAEHDVQGRNDAVGAAIRHYRKRCSEPKSDVASDRGPGRGPSLSTAPGPAFGTENPKPQNPTSDRGDRVGDQRGPGSAVHVCERASPYGDARAAPVPTEPPTPRFSDTLTEDGLL